MLFGSNTQQFFHSFLKADTPDDVTSIKIGFMLYKKFGKFAENLIYQDILNILNDISIDQMPDSKQIHWCYNEKTQIGLRNDKSNKKP